jgi:putative peptide zinc metalloprotease protein
LIAAPHRAPEQPLDHRLVSWSGDPTAAENQDCLLQPGDELMSIAVDQRWDAELVLGQSDVQRINVGAPVRLALEALPSVRLTGKVSEISRNEWTADEHSERRDDPAAARRGQPPLTSYVVRVQLDANPQFGMAGARAISRVETPSISVAGRVSRFLNSLFRFR